MFPPYRQVALSTVGVDPRTPQNRRVATGSDLFFRDGLAIGSAAMDLVDGTGSEQVTIFHTMDRLERSQLSSLSSVRELYVMNSDRLPVEPAP